MQRSERVPRAFNGDMQFSAGEIRFPANALYSAMSRQTIYGAGCVLPEKELEGFIKDILEIRRQCGSVLIELHLDLCFAARRLDALDGKGTSREN